MSVAAVERSPERFWRACLGRRLAGGTIEYLDLPEPADNDLVTLTLTFEPERVSRCLTVTQTEADWALADLSGGTRPSSTLPRRDAADHPILAPALGRLHDRAIWYADNDHIKAVRLDFDGVAFAVGLGEYEWHAASAMARFGGFSGDDLVLWRAEEFDALLRDHPLMIAMKQSQGA